MSIPIKIDRNQRRAIVGALLAASFFLVEAGIIEILLGMDQACRRSISSLRLAPDPFTACTPEWEWMLLHAASRGFAWLFNPAFPVLLAGLSMGVVYAFVGAVCASVFRGRGVFVYLAIHLAIISGVAGLSYLGQYLA
ncbi:MAG: hypothetical protein E4G99_08235 [Anaerolineales bacterium]|nr:MAG: hypothetical protein E4G99_08235 [Anaerolineales bacterium]